MLIFEYNLRADNITRINYRQELSIEFSETVQVSRVP